MGLWRPLFPYFPSSKAILSFLLFPVTHCRVSHLIFLRMGTVRKTCRLLTVNSPKRQQTLLVLWLLCSQYSFFSLTDLQIHKHLEIIVWRSSKPGAPACPGTGHLLPGSQLAHPRKEEMGPRDSLPTSFDALASSKVRDMG